MHVEKIDAYIHLFYVINVINEFAFISLRISENLRKYFFALDAKRSLL